MLSGNISSLLYLCSGVFFILSLRGLSSHEGSRRGSLYGITGMAIAVLTTLFQVSMSTSFVMLMALAVSIGAVCGITVARQVAMTAMPQLVAFFHSLVGLAAVFVAAAALYSPSAFGIDVSGAVSALALVEMSIGVVVGAITCAGSIVAFAKLNGNLSGKPIIFSHRHFINAGLAVLAVFVSVLLIATGSAVFFWVLVTLSLVLGVFLIIPIGGADMPVVISMLNSYSGWAAASIGFTLSNNALIVTGALVGSSGAILSYIICKGMNRAFIPVILGGFGDDSTLVTAEEGADMGVVNRGSPVDAAFIMQNAAKIIVVPGYGMAVAQAQHVLREMFDLLKQSGIDVKCAIHPVAGRMPGHMNVLLAEANISHEDVFELDEVNSEFAQTDVVYVIGANDITNPAAKSDPNSPIFGMPVLEVEKAGTVLFVKRGMSAGYAGIENELFYRPNVLMLFGDAKNVTIEIVKSLSS